MALLFSEVTLTVDQAQVKFLASGTPKTAADLDGWTAYEDFMEKHPESDMEKKKSKLPIRMRSLTSQ